MSEFFLSQFFLTGSWLGIVWFNSLTYDSPLFSDKNNPNIAKSNHTFPGKGRRWSFDFNIFDWSFSALLIYFDFSHLQGKQAIKVGPKVLTLGPSVFHKNSNRLKNFQTMFLFARVLPQLICRAYFGESKGPKTSQKGPFRGCWIGTQNWTFLTEQPQMLYWWNLPRLCIFMRV